MVSWLLLRLNRFHAHSKCSYSGGVTSFLENGTRVQFPDNLLLPCGLSTSEIDGSSASVSCSVGTNAAALATALRSSPPTALCTFRRSNWQHRSVYPKMLTAATTMTAFPSGTKYLNFYAFVNLCTMYSTILRGTFHCLWHINLAWAIKEPPKSSDETGVRMKGNKF